MDLNRKDGKLFWKLLDKLEKRPDDVALKESISGNRWKNHFQSICNSSDNTQVLPKKTKESGPLDYEISLEEIQLASYVLRNGKATGYDRISNEMLSCQKLSENYSMPYSIIPQ